MMTFTFTMGISVGWNIAVDAVSGFILAACRTEKRAAKAAILRFFWFGDHFLIWESRGSGSMWKSARFSLDKVTG